MLPSILAGKIVLKTSKISGREGSTWPGQIALKTDPKFIRKVIAQNPDLKIIFIAGTNGKTTTTKALTHVLEKVGHTILSNSTGANLLNGLASSLVKHTNMTGKLQHKVLIFEVDENSLPSILLEIPNPTAILILNLFRDQLDRYGEVNTIAEKWIESLKKLNDATLVIGNGDDPLVAYVCSYALSSSYFSVPLKYKTGRKLSHAVDSTSCPKCYKALNYVNISYSHLGTYICENCGYKNPKAECEEIPSLLIGVYNLYNLNAVRIISTRVFAIKEKEFSQAISSLKPAFGRQEVITVNGKSVMLLLSKNPTGFNESLKVSIDNKTSTLLLILNDRVPDGRDISWIWDVDFEILKNKKIKVYVSGDRCFDLANRLLFADVTYEVFENYSIAYKKAMNSTQDGQKLTILPTYSAMLEIRKLISGRSIL